MLTVFTRQISSDIQTFNGEDEHHLSYERQIICHILIHSVPVLRSTFGEDLYFDIWNIFMHTRKTLPSWQI